MSDTPLTYDGKSPLVTDALCSWQSIPCYCRWTNGVNVIIENADNGLTITVPISEIDPALSPEQIASKALQDLLSAYTGDPAGLAGWLVARGVKLGDK